MSQANLTIASGVPEPIVAKLRGLIARSRRVMALRGLCATLAVAIGSVLAVMAVDAGVTIFQDWPRWALSAGALAATLLTAEMLLATVLPLASRMVVTIATGWAVPDWFCTWVLAATVAELVLTVGVVTKVPQLAICTGLDTVSQTWR